MVMTSNVGISVRIDWVAPFNGASPITYFVLVIQSSTGAWFEETTDCNARTDLTVISNSYCVVPMSTLTAAPYNLVQGQVVVAMILAANIVG
jgi:hypothetical protein